MTWTATNPGVWKSDNGFKIMQAGRGRFICSHTAWTYTAPTLIEAQKACRAMSMTAWFKSQAAA